jgi:hypothetical protein
MSTSYNQPILFGTNAERLAWIAAHPGSAPAGEDALGGLRWFETDTGEEYIWDWTAGAWVQSAPSGAGGWPFTTWTVDPTNPNADEATIGAAVAGAGAGEWIKIGPGTYVENVSVTDINLIGLGQVLINGTLTLDGDCRVYNVETDGNDITTTAGGTYNLFNCRGRNAGGVDAFASVDIYGGNFDGNLQVEVGATVQLHNIPTFGGIGNLGTLLGFNADNVGKLGSTLGAYVTEFSTDGTLGGDSDLALPTEQSVKTYVDAAASGVDPTHTHSKIVASDGAPDPAWSVDAAGNLAAAGAYSLDVNAGEVILDADADTSLTADTDDQIDVKINNADEGHWTASGLSAQNFAFKVTNTSGGAAAVGDVGYIDAAGEYKTTTTAYSDVAWCVVVKGGADAADIYVARRGRVTVTLNGNCSAGDYLYTSTTAGQAQPEAYTRPELFGVALTANAGGAGGTCSALLLCDTVYRPINNANDVYRVSSHSSSDFVSTINGAPNATTVVYGAVTGGDENVINNASSSQLGKARLYNSTRGTYRLISSVNTGTNTITTVNTVDAWANGDTIDIESPTVTSPAAFEFIEIDLSQTTVIPELARAIALDMTVVDSGGAGGFSGAHPWAALMSSAEMGINTFVANQASYRTAIIPLYQRRFVYRSAATGAGTKTDIFRIQGVEAAAP